MRKCIQSRNNKKRIKQGTTKEMKDKKKYKRTKQGRTII